MFSFPSNADKIISLRRQVPSGSLAVSAHAFTVSYAYRSWGPCKLSEKYWSPSHVFFFFLFFPPGRVSAHYRLLLTNAARTVLSRLISEILSTFPCTKAFLSSLILFITFRAYKGKRTLLSFQMVRSTEDLILIICNAYVLSGQI